MKLFTPIMCYKSIMLSYILFLWLLLSYHTYTLNHAVCVLNSSVKSVCLCVRVCPWVGGCVLVGTYVSHHLSKLYSSIVSVYM